MLSTDTSIFINILILCNKTYRSISLRAYLPGDPGEVAGRGDRDRAHLWGVCGLTGTRGLGNPRRGLTEHFLQQTRKRFFFKHDTSSIDENNFFISGKQMDQNILYQMRGGSRNPHRRRRRQNYISLIFWTTLYEIKEIWSRVPGPATANHFILSFLFFDRLWSIIYLLFWCFLQNHFAQTEVNK